MFQLLQPIWLLATSAIIIPVAIHLWNIRNGKTLYVGSVSLLQESARQQSRSLRLKDILLLLLRCLLIVLLALLLSKPIWKKQLDSITEKGWIVIERQSMQEAYSHFKPIIDSLSNKGFKLHYLEDEFPVQNLEDALKVAPGDRPENSGSYWTLLKQLNEQVPPELPIYLFTTNELKRFAGTRPELAMKLNWKTYTTTDSIAKAIFKVYKASADSALLITANSKATTTYYTKSIAKNLSGETVLKGKSTDTLSYDTSTLRLVIFADQYAGDATYLKAAVDAIQQITSRAIKVSVINNAAQLTQGNDWLFWLSEKPLPAQSIAQKTFVYERGKEQALNSFIKLAQESSVNEQGVHLTKIIQNDTTGNYNREVIWKDGFGHPVLSCERTGNALYHFYSRFSPAWNDLVWNNQFADMVYKLLIMEDADIKPFDRRIIDAQQLQPILTQEKQQFDKQKFIETTDLSKLFWIAAFLIFCIERYLSMNPKVEKYA